jgi:O-antigen/teichoic acid export membrane protein
VAGSIVGKGVEMATLVVLATVVPRALGPTDYGRFVVPLTIVTLGSLALTLGGPSVMARYVPAAPPDQRVDVARALGARLARGRAIQLALAGLVTAVAVAVAPDHVPPSATALVAVALVLNVATSLLLQVALGLGRTGAWSTRYPLQNAVLIVAVLVLHASHGPIGATAALVVAAAVAGAFGVAVVRSAAPRASGSRAEIPAGALRFGALQATGAALAQAYQRGGVLAVAVLAGSSTETGYAGLAVGIALGATYAILQSFTVTLPHLAAAEGSEDEPEAVLRRLGEGSLLVLLPALLVTAAVLHRVVPIVFGDEFRGAVDAFAPALAVIALSPLNALLVQVTALRLRPQVSASSGAAGFGAFVVTALVAVPAWGATGGVVATLVAAATDAAVSARLLPRAAGARLVIASFAGAALVLAVASA